MGFIEIKTGSFPSIHIGKGLAIFWTHCRGDRLRVVARYDRKNGKTIHLGDWSKC